MLPLLPSRSSSPAPWRASLRRRSAASDAAGRAAEATRDTACEAKDKAAGGAQQAGGYVAQTAEAAKQKAAGAAQYAKETVVAGKDKTGALLQQVL